MGQALRFSIGSKLVIVFAILILGFGALLFSTLDRFARLQEAEEQQFQRHYQRVTLVNELRTNLANLRGDLLLALDADTQGEQDLQNRINRGTGANDRIVNQLQADASGDAEVAKIIDRIVELRTTLVEVRMQQLRLIQEGRFEAAGQPKQQEQAERLDRINELGSELTRLTDRRIKDALVASQQQLETTRTNTFQLCLMLVIISGVLAWLLSRHISKPLAWLTGLAEQIGRGDIPRTVPTSARQDEVGSLAKAFADMSLYLREMVQEINEGVSVLASSSEEILAATSQAAASTQETATAISEIATTVEEVKQTAVLASTKSKSVTESAERTRLVAQSGFQAVDEALKGMQQIREQMQAVAESIMRLGDQTQAIGEIVATVGDLAEQSNLLGVNASIEAAKAGEAGKGFSVVAQEVKALADQSKQATAQVRGILGDIQKAMTKAVLLAEQGSKAVETGYERARVSGESIRTLSGSIEESSDVALQIAATSQQQMAGMDQVSSAMDYIRQASQDNVGGTRQVDEAARNLHEVGLKLKTLTSRFRL
ncbi:methyl-accepting chemotaxis protein [Pseudomonas sp. Q2-TVG4-2]|uniref:methyl-accepting chemotaxis protein n=1 Tax=Pseudomonas sp. Q2-TVG4-2 TaxID=1685699 RepID=UPI001C6386FF|nr:methyl-accepting chemotaxis protein [Pseudomonas sp. Q2-TVG4-2]